MLVSEKATPAIQLLQLFSWGALCFVAGAMFIGSYGRTWPWLFAFAAGIVAGAAVTLLGVLYRYRKNRYEVILQLERNKSILMQSISKTESPRQC